jgi:hypothetical protein
MLVLPMAGRVRLPMAKPAGIVMWPADSGPRIMRGWRMMLLASCACSRRAVGWLQVASNADDRRWFERTCPRPIWSACSSSAKVPSVEERQDPLHRSRVTNSSRLDCGHDHKHRPGHNPKLGVLEGRQLDRHR